MQNKWWFALFSVFGGLVIGWVASSKSNSGNYSESIGGSCEQYEEVRSQLRDLFPDARLEDVYLDPTESTYKWRQYVGKAYVEYPAVSSFEIYLPNDYEHWLEVYRNQVVPTLSSSLILSEENSVPLYTYPGGTMAIKNGFTTMGNTHYLVGMYEELAPTYVNDKLIINEHDEVVMSEQVVLRVICGFPQEDYKEFYDRYFTQASAKELPGETVISYNPHLFGSDTNMIDVIVKYPGAPVWGFYHEFWHNDKQGELVNIESQKPGLNCSGVDGRLSESRVECFDESLRQFRLNR